MNRHFARLAAIVLAVAALTAAQSSAFAATNIVTNGGFETGDFTGWTQSGNTAFTTVISDSGVPHSGTFGLHAGPTSLGSISQLLNTTPGATYQLEFWLRNEGSTPNSFAVSWGNSQVFSLSNQGALAYTLYTVPNLTASSASTALTFSFVHVPSFWDLDDISVVQTGSTPGAVPDGGSSIGLLGTVLLAVGVIRRRFLRQ